MTDERKEPGEIEACCVCGLRFSAGEETVQIPCGEAHKACAEMQGHDLDQEDEG